jgi:hypothetical protein
MALLALVVLAGMAGTLFWFLRRLNAIQRECWGDKHKEWQ